METKVHLTEKKVCQKIDQETLKMIREKTRKNRIWIVYHREERDDDHVTSFTKWSDGSVTEIIQTADNIRIEGHKGERNHGTEEAACHYERSIRAHRPE